MKKIVLKQLTLVNFKGEKNRTMTFSPFITEICGDNGTGKSRHFDAFIWLLFGKDAAERKDYEIKTRVAGEELHRVECSVEGVLEVDSTQVILKRALAEDWVKPRGQAEQVFKGNHTECRWNDTPVSVTEYDRRVAAIVPADIFKMVTNPAFFATMKWQLQREQLLLLAGTVSDEEVASANPAFRALLEKISGKPLMDFRAELAARKKRLKTELAEIQPRIDQTHRMMPEGEDFSALEEEIGSLDKETDRITAAMESGEAAAHELGEERRKVQEKINALKAECQRLLFDAQEKARQAAREANSERNLLFEECRAIEQETEECRGKMVEAEVEIARLHLYINKAEEKQEQLRQAWYEENAKPYTGSPNCAHCGQPLPSDMIKEAHRIFNAAKEERCGEIISEGRRYGERIKTCRIREQELSEQLQEQAKRRAELMKRAEELKEQLARIPEIGVSLPLPQEVEGYGERQAEISALEKSLPPLHQSKERERELSLRRKELERRRSELAVRLARREDIERCREEIRKLEEEGRQTAQQLADAEKQEYTMQEFTRAKVSECEKRVNTMFKQVTFRLYDYTLEGNPVETCIPLIEGVPYGAANTASRVNAGLDIITTLSRYYGVSAPVFIDNAESINRYMAMENQMILLKVTGSKTLETHCYDIPII